MNFDPAGDAPIDASVQATQETFKRLIAEKFAEVLLPILLFIFVGDHMSIQLL